MSNFKTDKTKCLLLDIALAFCIAMFVILAMSSPTVGNVYFYDKSFAKSNVTDELQKNLVERTDKIAEETGVEAKAFSFAVGKTKISSIQKQIVHSIFSGTNHDYSESERIEEYYRKGIQEYYRANGLNLEDTQFEKAVSMACQAFNRNMGISNTSQVPFFVQLTSKYSIVGALAFALIIVVLIFKIFEINLGRTKTYSHIGSSMICAGDAMMAVAIISVVLGLVNKLYLTNNTAINLAISRATNIYFIALAIFGLAFSLAGASMLKYVYNYYHKKATSQKTEYDINKDILVKVEDGEVTIKELFEGKENGEE